MTPTAANALCSLFALLKREGYQFITTTPVSHGHVLARDAADRVSRDLRDLLGWNRRLNSLAGGVLAEAQDLLRAAGLVREGSRAAVRASTCSGQLFFHASYPTSEADAVFFGPDTYRFARFIRATVLGGGRLLDLGTGSGAAGVLLADRFERVVLSDLNQAALAMASLNADLNGVTNVSVCRSSYFDAIEGRFDAIVANPPFMIDVEQRRYRDGGSALGTEVAREIVTRGLERLERGGTLALYTGSPIVVGGLDPLREAIEATVARAPGFRLEYAEVDPDIFGEELLNPAYAEVERLAAVTALVHAPD